MKNLDYDIDPPVGIKCVLRDLSRPLWALLLLALLLPALIAGWFAWQRHNANLNEVHLMAQRSVIALEQHMGNVLQTHALLLRQIADRTQGRPWRAIASDIQLQRTFAELTNNFKQVSLIGLADANGRLRMSSAPHTAAGDTLADRDYFIAHKDGTARETFFSRPFASRMDKARQFIISIARTGSSGEFDGIIFAAVSLDYFTNFWKQFVPSEGYLIPLMREDGKLLIRYPMLDSPERRSANGPFVTHVKTAPRGLYTAVSQVDGIERINAYSQVNDYPLYISFSVETDIVLRKWRDEILPALIMTLLAAAALLALSVLVIRQSYLQRRVATRWRKIAHNLESEIKHREGIEEQLRQAQKMEAFGQLTGGIAHDFNNMLASIVGNLELIRAYVATGAMGAISQCVDRAEAVSDRAAEMIQGLLTFARRKTLKSEPVKINALLQSAADLFERAVGPHIKVETILPDVSPVALCDAAQLETALLNLVINARDAMPDGGRITITASTDVQADTDKVISDALPQRPNVILSMSDNGVGMPDDVLKNAFEPFFTTKGIGEGSGLGLSMVFGFAAQSGGHVKIESKVQAGTKVTLSLPAYTGVVQDGEPDLEGPASPIRVVAGTLLLVEDDVAVRHVLAEVLQRSGATVLQAGSGEEALKVMATAPPLDLVITDIGLSGELNGYQFADAARRMREGLSFLFISGYSNGSPGAELSVLPEDRVLSKPFKTGVFLETLAVMLWSRAGGTG
jgi:two-component system NtrC family sensor kinase